MMMMMMMMIIIIIIIHVPMAVEKRAERKAELKAK
jgi:hypothetical protein